MNPTLTLFTHCSDYDQNDEIQHYLTNGYLIEHEEEVSAFEDGSKIVRYLLLKDDPPKRH